MKLILVLLIVSNGPLFAKGISQVRLASVECVEGETVDLTCIPSLGEIFYIGARLEDITCGNTGYFIFWSKISPSMETISSCQNLYHISLFYNIFLINQRYILRIANVQKHNEGIYQCHTFNSFKRKSNIEIKVHLSVYQPQCETYPTSNVQLGDRFTIICSLQLNRTLQLIDSKNRLLAEIHQPFLTYAMNLTNANNYETFQCKVLTRNGEYNPTCSISVRFPYVKIEPEDQVVAREGNNVVFRCFAKLGEKKSHRYNFIWTLNDEIVSEGTNKSVFTLNHISKSSNKTQVQCGASVNGNSNRTFSTVTVIYVRTLAIASSTQQPTNINVSPLATESLTQQPTNINVSPLATESLKQ